MKKSNYQWFYQENFLDENLFHLMLSKENQCVDLSLLIEKDGSVSYDTDGVIKNRYSDNTIIKKILPNPTVSVITILENKLKSMGLKNPVLYNLHTLINPTPKKGTRGYGWHKDFNCIKHTNDPLKLWFTMLSLTDKKVNSEFMISPTKDGPTLWNIGIQTTVDKNKLFGHNMNLGHDYIAKDKNELGFLYIRWFDAD